MPHQVAGKDHHQGDQEQRQDVAVLDRRLEKGQVLVCFVGLRDLLRPLGHALRHDSNRPPPRRRCAYRRHRPARRRESRRRRRKPGCWSLPTPRSARVKNSSSGFTVTPVGTCSLNATTNDSPSGEKSSTVPRLYSCCLFLDEGLQFGRRAGIEESFFGDRLGSTGARKRSRCWPSSGNRFGRFPTSPGARFPPWRRTSGRRSGSAGRRRSRTTADSAPATARRTPSTRRDCKREPRMRRLRSKISLTRLRTTRKTSSTSRMMLTLMSRKKTMLLPSEYSGETSGN